ncbi:hypothetical protein [Pseudoflavonifractor hominis]|uniref:CPBP family intramembrane metalloprotease n=1 Tax=Pseudoflavonifractor hominis TaxID=2763059 RepID=A0ABR7HSN4_9FIRM|nr:hypothetical protein [Pseudoflavonifractor hominis]MBC5730530.1 hypothetical protein [Pseudoflavonifractor hominis]
MKRNIALLLLGILPLPLGYALNFVILSLPSSSILLYAVSIGFLLLWVLLARRVSAREGQPIVQALLLSAFGLLMLLLVLYQELVMGRYWFNLLGAAPQLYFLPLLSLGFTLSNVLIQPFLPTLEMWLVYLLAWLLLFAAGCAGCFWKARGK